MRPATPAPRPISLAPIAPAPEVKPVVLLNARIYPGPDLADRKVLLSIAEEGRPPAFIIPCTYADLLDVIRDKFNAFFAVPAPLVGEPETLYEDEIPADDTGTETEEEE